jgi:hypothetical protein
MTKNDDFVKHHKLDIRLYPENSPANPWIKVCTEEAEKLCHEVTEIPVSFAFTASARIQAQALYEPRSVVMTWRLFNRLCHLSANLVSKGLYVKLGKQKPPVWTKDPSRAGRPMTSFIDLSSFNWRETSAAWSSDPERQWLFAYVLLTIFRFVVLHELGHIHYKHGLRRGGHPVSLEVDAIHPTLYPEEDAIPSQARELVADEFAWRVLTKLQAIELELKANTVMGKGLISKLLQTDRDRIRFLLSTIYLYFYSSDRHDWLAINPIHLSHPPSPFRWYTIAAGFVEHGNFQIPADQAPGLFKDSFFEAASIVAVAYDQLPDMKWLDILSTDQYKKLYAVLYQEIPKWNMTDLTQK